MSSEMASALHSKLYGVLDAFIADQPNRFTIITHNSSNQRLPFGGEKFEIQVRNNGAGTGAGGGGEEVCEVDVQVSDRKDGTYDVVWQLAPHHASLGRVVLSVKLRGIDISPTPLVLCVPGLVKGKCLGSFFSWEGLRSTGLASDQIFYYIGFLHKTSPIAIVDKGFQLLHAFGNIPFSYGLVLSNDNELFCNGGDSVWVYSTQGLLLRKLRNTPKMLPGPVAIDTRRGEVYVPDIAGEDVVVYDKATGQQLRALGKRNQFRPTALCMSGELLYAGGEFMNVTALDREGTVSTVFEPVGDCGWCASVVVVGQVLYASCTDGLRAYGLDGKFIGFVGQLRRPGGLCVSLSTRTLCVTGDDGFLVFQ